jgi:hypothetical protein
MINVFEALTVGEPSIHQGITLFPIFSSGLTATDILAFGDSVSIAEKEDAEVPVLLATNGSAHPVLLAEGDVLHGGRQTRTINVSVLLAPNSTVELPVSCVEAGRWGGGRAFQKADYAVSREVRRTKSEGVSRNIRARGSKQSDQGEVWGSIAKQLDQYHVASSTSSFAAVRESLNDRSDVVGAAEQLISAGPAAGQVGVVVAYGKAVVSAEVFCSAELLRANWAPMIRSVLIEGGVSSEGQAGVAEANEFLQSIGRSESVVSPGVGLGDERHVRSDHLVGQVLEWNSALVHASAFSLST